MALFSDDNLEYKLLSKDEVETVLRIQAETMRQENLAIGVGMFEDSGAPEEMSLVFREVIKDGATLVAVDRETKELAAVAFNKIHAKPLEGVKDELEIFIEKNLKHEACLELVTFLANIEGSVDIFEKYKVNGVMELFYLGTNPQYQGRGIGRKMVQRCIDFGRGLLNGSMKTMSIDGTIIDQLVPPQLIFGVFASNYSQSIADKLGFATLKEVLYDDYTFAGVKMSERIGNIHRTAKLQVMKF